MALRINHDIGDDEIRIISSLIKKEKDESCLDIKADDENGVGKDESVNKTGIRSRRFIIAGCVIVAALILWIAIDAINQADEDPVVVVESAEVKNDIENETVASVDAVTETQRCFAEVTDTVVGGVPVMIITPVGATPSLHVGTDVLADSTAVLIVQAADVRGDNGEIVGSYVNEGELLSRGQSKAGFCAIINGVTTVGVAESTPYMEQALENSGYFFRQYPLVVANQIVENKLKNRALRKALAELDGRTVVVIGRKRQTMHEFSQTLVDLGVSNAIYLVGSAAYGVARDGSGNLIEFGTPTDNAPANTNYIVWK